ncbi:hypothetical protein WJX84_000065 [Apatococcus fuscideae]|uniref:Uncharacterized protein n=1 Tax=Apatococcus fuscideae TaxID=2026836 RepID=A0AAW1T171_9CHLO
MGGNLRWVHQSGDAVTLIKAGSSFPADLSSSFHLVSVPANDRDALQPFLAIRHMQAITKKLHSQQQQRSAPRPQLAVRAAGQQITVDIDKPTGLSLGEGKGKGGGLVIKNASGNAAKAGQGRHDDINGTVAQEGCSSAIRPQAHSQPAGARTHICIRFLEYDQQTGKPKGKIQAQAAQVATVVEVWLA